MSEEIEKTENKAKGVLNWLRELEQRVNALEQELAQVKMHSLDAKQEVRELKKEVEEFF